MDPKKFIMGENPPGHGMEYRGMTIHTQPAWQYFEWFPNSAWEVFLKAPEGQTWFIGILVKTDEGWHRLTATPNQLSFAYDQALTVLRQLAGENISHVRAELLAKQKLK